MATEIGHGIGEFIDDRKKKFRSSFFYKDSSSEKLAFLNNSIVGENATHNADVQSQACSSYIQTNVDLLCIYQTVMILKSFLLFIFFAD